MPEFPSELVSSSIATIPSSNVIIQCQMIASLFANKSAMTKDPPVLPIYFRKLLEKNNVTLNLSGNVDECVKQLLELVNHSSPVNIPSSNIPKHSQFLIGFVILISIVSIISILGNLCLAKVLYSKRHRLMQTDRIVLCLALSELCLVLIDTPTEIYRFLSVTFAQEWLCRFHTFFEALFSSCIIFYHLLGAFDRFVYIHGHTSSKDSPWSKWYRYLSMKSGSVILLIVPVIGSLPIAICNCLHAHISYAPMGKKTCFLQYADGSLIALLIAFYIVPLFLSFFLHGKLIYFIRSRHSQDYLSQTAYVLSTKRQRWTSVDDPMKRRLNREKGLIQNEVLLEGKHPSSRRRFVLMNVDTIGSTTTTTMGGLHSPPIYMNQRNHSSNSSQSSRSSTAVSSSSITSPMLLYKINTQANANAKRTVLLLVLLLSFYLFCWAPYNIYTWQHAYRITRNRISSSPDFNQSSVQISLNNFNMDLRRFILINYALYLLSMVSMCFSFIFYFSLNKQARHELTHFIGCMCPQMLSSRKKQLSVPPQKLKQLPCRTRFQQQQSYPRQNERVKISPPVSLRNERYNHVSYLPKTPTKRTVLNYGCQIRCCH